MSLVIMTLTRGQHRHCSTHHQTTTHMLRHNKTAKWMSRKRSADIASLIMFARTIGRCLRQDHCQQEQVVMLQIREKLVEDERKKNLREAKQAEVKQQILRRLIACVGPCETSDDVDCLIHRLQRDKDCVLLEALKDQIRYQKTILGRKGSLCLSGSVEDLILALKEHLSDPAFLWSLSHSFSQKMKTLMVDTMNLTLFSHQKKRSCPGEDADDADDDDDDDRALFSFCKQGQWVAVLYDDQFYIGQVIEVAHGQSAVVKCLEQTKGQKDYYRWPRSEDVAETSAHYVYRWDFEVTPVSNDGRVWEVANIDDIASGYELINGVKTHRKLLFFGT